MSRPLLLKMAMLGAAVAAPTGIAFAQAWVPGSEIAGQTVQVQTNNVTNTIYFAPDGTASIGTAQARPFQRPGRPPTTSCA